MYPLLYIVDPINYSIEEIATLYKRKEDNEMLQGHTYEMYM